MEEKIILRGEYIKLDQALKHILGVSGGEAKDMILEGAVFVNGEAAFQRGKKLRGGDRVEVDDTKILILEQENME